MATQCGKNPNWRFGVSAVGGIVLAALLIWYLVRGAYPDLRFNLNDLRGLTPEQVISRFGPPEIDDRKGPNPWTPAREHEWGPLVFIYEGRHTWLDWGYGIVFEDNHVVKVTAAHK
jgi:hypothetical protein